MTLASNDDTRLPSMAAFQAMRALNTATPLELAQIVAAATGALHQKMGAVHVGKVWARVTDELRGEKPLTLYDVAIFVAQKYQIRVADLVAPYDGVGTRLRTFSIPRHEAFWLARRQPGVGVTYRYSLPQIGAFFGGRDHTSVIHGVRKHEKRMALNAMMAWEEGA